MLLVRISYFLLVVILSIFASLIQQQKSFKFYKYHSNLGDYNVRFEFKEQSVKNSNITPIVCIHGFGGNADQFRKNLPALAQDGFPAYAIDLLGFGYSDKPNPKNFGKPNAIYNFENWANMTCSFVEDIVRAPCVLVCNSIGGSVGLEAAKMRPDLIKGVVLIDISLRMLNVRKQMPIIRPLVSALQTVLRETGVGKAFFSQVAQRDALRDILDVAYASRERMKYLQSVGETDIDNVFTGVDDETVDIILQPGLLPGAADVFLDFISYSGGPLPEDVLPLVQCPVRMLWGELDPWEPLSKGRSAYGSFPCVDEFVTLPGAGHCPMDQVPELVNAEILRFMRERMSK